MTEPITYRVVCCESKTVGRIDDRRAVGSGVTVWSPIAPPRWQDRPRKPSPALHV